MCKSLVLHSAEDGGIYSQIVELTSPISLATQMKVVLNLDQEIFGQIEARAQIALYRILKEQLNNVVKYAEANTEVIALKETADEYHLSIKDNGRAFDVNERRRGIGLSNIATRGRFFKR